MLNKMLVLLFAAFMFSMPVHAAYFNALQAPQNTCFMGSNGGGTGTASFRALVGADLPNPSATTLGGVESYASVSHQWINSISTSGVPASSQPACGDLSDAVASCSTDTTNASNISSGTLGVAEGGTGANLSATGGAHQVLQQSSSGGAVTVGQLAASDISGLSGQINVVKKTAAYTAACGDIVLADATGGAFTVTLPAATSSQCEIKIAKVDSSANAVTVAGAGADTVTGAASQSLPGQWDSGIFVADGTSSWAAF